MKRRGFMTCYFDRQSRNFVVIWDDQSCWVLKTVIIPGGCAIQIPECSNLTGMTELSSHLNKQRKISQSATLFQNAFVDSGAGSFEEIANVHFGI
jgi:hypothetical protein